MTEVSPHEFSKTMRWYDGFVLSLTMPAALIAALGYSIGALGGWSAIALWGTVMVLASLTNWVYSEMASMFPDKPGGIALYAHEGWKRHLSLVGRSRPSATGSLGQVPSPSSPASSAPSHRPSGSRNRTGRSTGCCSS